MFDLAECLASLNNGNIIYDDVVFDEDVKEICTLMVTSSSVFMICGVRR